MPDDVRKAMDRDAAREIAAPSNTKVAGTVEFIVDWQRRFSIDSSGSSKMKHAAAGRAPGLNENESPATDLSNAAFMSRGGGELPLAQDEITLRGHAIGRGICAEEPVEASAPAAGLDPLEFGPANLGRWRAFIPLGTTASEKTGGPRAVRLRFMIAS